VQLQNTRGDRSPEWRAAYRRVRKDPCRSAGATNRKRLTSVRAEQLQSTRPWLDLGAGDGNLVPVLASMGITDIVALDYQRELLVECPRSVRRVAGSAFQLPFDSAAFDVVVSMDLLHHLAPAQLGPTLDEIRRVLSCNGTLLVVEPADTWVRRVLTPLVRSPLASLTAFSRDKRSMVELEADTLEPWLRNERCVFETFRAAGFEIEHQRRGPLHAATRLRMQRQPRMSVGG
jgi:2-polyprenyl-3-methyl-5-hydroxy-6-metoxy-1,4-benzoquinol methylase